MTGYDSLLLDFDGVLVTVLDRERRLAACWDAVVGGFSTNIALDRETVTTLSHSVSPDRVQSMSYQLDVAPETLWQLRDDLLERVLTDAAAKGRKRPYPDVAALAKLDVPLGIASNNQRRIVEYILDEYEFREQFETVHAREPRLESLQHKKPEPTLLERAHEDIEGSNPLYVGDKQKDIIAANRAGMDAAFVRRDHNSDRALNPVPTHEITSLDDLVPLFEVTSLD